jgi:glycine dehydrogenase
MSFSALQQKEFKRRHIGIAEHDLTPMLNEVGVASLEELIEKTVPENIVFKEKITLDAPMSEQEYLNHVKALSLQNKVFKSYIGQGYYNTLTPSVILRNVFENPGWYTQYTPYQAEIAQGRLESLLNFQTMVSDLTALPIANASLLDESTAAAEAMTMFFSHANKTDNITKPKFFIDEFVFAQTKDLCFTRAIPFGIEITVGNFKTSKLDVSFFGALLQYPNSHGSIEDYTQFIADTQAIGGLVVMATDLMALTTLKAPGELGADCAVGNSQRFGVPLGFGGPHAAFFAAKDEFKRSLPGRIIGVSIDADGNRALRMALQTREQHIKREKATSNICTAQALLANMAAMYAVYHGPAGLKNIATRISTYTLALAKTLKNNGIEVLNKYYFDTVSFKLNNAKQVITNLEDKYINIFSINENTVSVSIDETTTLKDIELLASTLTNVTCTINLDKELSNIPTPFKRTSTYLLHPVFNTHHSETQMMRYIKYLENKDLSLNTSMISLGSCTMKLNAATEMMPLSWPEFSQIHPFAPNTQTKGYQAIINKLSEQLCKITAFDACSMQPNSGAQGEYAGLLTIRNFHEANNESHRNVMIIPISAHGTNPASAIMAGMKVVVVKALDNGYIDLVDLKAKVEEHSANLSGIMITYPSTYGVYEETVIEITNLIHANGGQVYMDGANMNAQVGLTAPGLIGADVCHLNLHKTFAIPHGGGGPGMGPICVKAHLAKHLPGHVYDVNNKNGAVSGAQFGSASILLISYAYICMLGEEGCTASTQYAILNANYMRARLQKDFDILYLGNNGTCAHEFIIDLRPFKKTAEIEAEDVAKRLIDYSFHAPTMSFPVAGTIMIEPTESEDKAELDRFCDALLSIRAEIAAIENGQSDKKDNPLKNAPHTQAMVINSNWAFSYSRETAVFPLPYLHQSKFWPTVRRVNNTHGDRNLICTCAPMEAYM